MQTALLSGQPNLLPPAGAPGTLYGSLLNQGAQLDALASSIHGDWGTSVYKAAPQAPVLYIKSRNTFVGSGAKVLVPAGCDAVEIGATWGLIIGKTACRVSASQALEFVSGIVLVNDLSIPHASVHRPPVRYRCRDGFCPIAGQSLPVTDMLPELSVWLDQTLQQTVRFARLLRSPAQLIADVSAFMTLQTGDILHVGVDAAPALARAGQQVRIEAQGLAPLVTNLVAA